MRRPFRAESLTLPEPHRVRVFELHHSWVVMGKVVGWLALAIAIVALVLPLLAVDTRWWAAALFALGFGASGLLCLRIGYRSIDYALELSEDGIRLPADGRWEPWSRLTNLRERRFLNRLDVLDESGSRFCSLVYHLDGFGDALELTLEHLALLPPERDRFGRPAPGVIFVGVLALIAAPWIVVWLFSGIAVVLLPSVILFGVGIGYVLLETWSVSLETEGLKIRRGYGSDVIPWADIAKVELALRHIGSGRLMLDVVLVRRDGDRRSIRPVGANPFHLHGRIVQRLEG